MTKAQADRAALALCAAIAAATVAAGALAPSPPSAHKAAPPPPAAPVEAGCAEWSDGCVVCVRTPAGRACSTPGIACTRGEMRCARRE